MTVGLLFLGKSTILPNGHHIILVGPELRVCTLAKTRPRNSVITIVQWPWRIWPSFVLAVCNNETTRVLIERLPLPCVLEKAIGLSSRIPYEGPFNRGAPYAFDTWQVTTRAAHPKTFADS